MSGWKAGDKLTNLDWVSSVMINGVVRYPAIEAKVIRQFKDLVNKMPEESQKRIKSKAKALMRRSRYE